MFENLKTLTTRLFGRSATALARALWALWWRRVGHEARWAAAVIAAEFGAARIRKQRRIAGGAR